MSNNGDGNQRVSKPVRMLNDSDAVERPDGRGPAPLPRVWIDDGPATRRDPGRGELLVG